jgi:hypothetical protein
LSKFEKVFRSLYVYALIFLLSSMIFGWQSVPVSYQTDSSEPIYLHSKNTLVPIHMHSNESLVPIHMHSNITLTPVHMHYTGDPAIDPIYEPMFTDWHELYPEYCQKWILTSFVDNGDGILSACDQIDMTYEETGEVTWYHVDRITWTMLLTNAADPEDIMYVEFKGPPDVKDPINNPVCTYWHEVYPRYSNVYHITGASGPLEYCTFIDLYNVTGDVFAGTWHVEEVVTDLILREKIMDPICTWWHEIYPDYCEWWHLHSWEDNGDGMLSPSDQIDMTNYASEEEMWDIFWSMGDVNRDGYINETDLSRIEAQFGWTGPPGGIPEDINSDGKVDVGDMTICSKNQGVNFWAYFYKWYHVDRVTLTLNITKEFEDQPILIEFKGSYEEMYGALSWPLQTMWHEVYPDYCNIYTLTWWDWMEDDNCNGVLDVCDYIWLMNEASGIEERYHVDDICYDIILNEKIMDPRGWHGRGTIWHELYPSFCNYHDLTSWEEEPDDPYPGRLSPSDQIDMYNETSGETKWYHVDRVTLGLYITINMSGEPYYFEYKGPFEDMYMVKTKPICTLWTMVWPDYLGEGALHIEDWIDNCNGVLDYCDYILLSGVWCHVEEVAIDIILNEKITDPVCTYWHELYPEFCNEYHIEGWEDNGDGLLSPCDFVDLALLPTGPTEEYHVEYVTVTINITDPYVPGWWIILEYYYEGPVETMYWVKTHPIGSWWYEPGWIGEEYQIQNWTDNCNGVLDYCDYVMFYDYWYHVEEVAIDMVVGPLPIHDVAVTKVASLKDWVYQGQIDPISVTITNYGDYDESTVDVYALYDETLAAPKQTTSLLVGETKTLTFNWETTGVPPGFYTVSANATIPIDDVPGNNYVLGNVQEVRELPPPPEDLELYPREVVDLEIPLDTQWHELHPSKTNYYHLTDWLPGAVLGPEDFVLMDGTEFLVDDLTIDIEVLDTESGIIYWLDYECGYWTFSPEDPVCTKWNEIKNSETHAPPEWPRCWHLTEWYDDNEDGTLSYCDYIMMTPNDPYPGAPHLFHVELVTVTLKLTDTDNQQHYLEFMGTLEEFEAMDYIHFPWDTMWVEIWPEQGRLWLLMDWADQPYLAPSDQIILTLKDPETHEPIPGTEAEYHVDKVTVAMNLTNMIDGMMHIVKFEGSLVQFKYHYWMYDPPYSEGPYGTQWHEVNPTYCRQWYLVSWDDDGDYMLDFCDYILMVDKETGEEVWFHVESLSTDIFVTLKVHDVAVTNVTSAKTVVCQGCCGNITVTVENQGGFTETFNVTAYANTTVIQTKAITLTSGDSANMAFMWNATGFAKGNYTIKAIADKVLGETDTGDNTYVDEWIIISMLGDITGPEDPPGSGLKPPDGKCDMRDVGLVARYFGQFVPPGPANCDITGPTKCVPDGKIDMRDVGLVARHFGETDP